VVRDEHQTSATEHSESGLTRAPVKIHQSYFGLRDPDNHRSGTYTDLSSRSLPLTYYYQVAAVATNGIRSIPSAAISALPTTRLPMGPAAHRISVVAARSPFFLDANLALCRRDSLY